MDDLPSALKNLTLGVWKREIELFNLLHELECLDLIFHDVTRVRAVIPLSLCSLNCSGKCDKFEPVVRELREAHSDVVFLNNNDDSGDDDEN